MTTKLKCPECGQAMPPQPFDLEHASVAPMLDGPMPTDTAVAASLARTAADILKRIDEGRYPTTKLDSAAWRLADALYLVGQATEGTPLDGECPGLDQPTGRGAKLYHEGDL